MKTRTALTTLLALAAATIASFAHAGTGNVINPGGIVNGGVIHNPITLQPDTNSADFLQPFVKFMTSHQEGYGNYSIGFTLVSNRGDGLASYSSGTLYYNGGKLSGDGNQLFSDRLYAWPSQGGGLNLATYPFNPYTADNLGVSIDPTTGNVTLTLKSWGNTKITFTTLADTGAGLIYGFAQKGSANPRQMVLINLQDHFSVIPG